MGQDENFASIFNLFYINFKMMLPNKNGLEIIKEIRRSEEIPIIVVSARNEDIDKIRGLDFGADDYLTKPFSPAEPAARIKAHITTCTSGWHRMS